MPDVTMIPAIAIFFDVSTDELFDFNRLETEQKIQDACWEIASIRYDEPARAEKLLRELLKQYPGNEVILNNLLYTMRTPDRAEEVITLCRSILEVCRDDTVKYDVLRILAETYHEMGQQNLVKPTLEQIPEIYFSKLELAAKLLEGEDAMHAAKMQANLCRDDLLDMLSRMSQLYRLQGEMEKSIEFSELTRAVYKLFADRSDDFGYNWHQCKWLNETVWPRLAE